MEGNISNPTNFSCVSSICTAPSSPGRSSCSNIISEEFYFSEPTSPTHSILKSELQISNSTRDLQRTVLPVNVNWENKNIGPRITSPPGKKKPPEEEIIYNDGIDDHGTASYYPNNSFEFEFSARFSEVEGDPVSADELFFNGQIRPLSLPHRLIQQTQSFRSTVVGADLSSGNSFRPTVGGADLNSRNSFRSNVGSDLNSEKLSRSTIAGLSSCSGSTPRRVGSHGSSAQTATRKEIEFPESTSGSCNFSKSKDHDQDIRSHKGRSPLRNFLFDERKKYDPGDNDDESGNVRNLPETAKLPKDSNNFMKSRSTRSSKRWSLKDFLYRSASEGRADGKDRLWGLSLIIPPARQAQKHSMKKPEAAIISKQYEKFQPDCSLSAKSQDDVSTGGAMKELCDDENKIKLAESVKVPAESINGSNYFKVGKRVAVSAHELHYKANRAHADELRKKSYLPYRQGLFGCLGFSTKTYTTVSGLTSTLHPFS